MNRELRSEPISDYQGEEISIISPLRSINIDPLDYGFIVRIGCQNMAVESKTDLIKYLTDYINNPNETEEKYYKKELLKHQK